MNIKKNNTLFAVIIILLVSLVILLVGYIVYNKLDNNKNEVTLTKAEKDALVKTEVDDLVKILNVSTNNSALGCSDFDDDLFEMSNENVERLEVLDRIAPYLMACKYKMEYKKIDDNNDLGYTYLMDQSMYDKFRSYFNTTLNSKLINNQKYYEAFHSSSGGVLRQYSFKLDDDKITEVNDVYSAVINFYEINDFSHLVTKAVLELSIKDNHVYYRSFEIRNDLLKG